MTTQAILDAEIDSQFPDNNQNLITPAIQRGVLHDMVAFTQQQNDELSGSVAVGSLTPPVLANGTDQTANLQAAIDFYSAAGGVNLRFGVGTYIFNSSIILKPNVILTGVGIDVTILKVGVDNVTLIDRWGSVGQDTGIGGITDMTLWGFGDRNLVQNTSPIANIGPFHYYWLRKVKVIYGNNMGIKGIGGTGIVDECVVNQCLRDGINLTDTTHVKVTNNDISQVGDDAIAYHLPVGTTGIQDNSVRVTNNQIEKSFGIKILGGRNVVISNNVIRFYTGYGIQVGIDDVFGEGLITKYGISITGNTMLDGLNANVFGGGNIGYGIFLFGVESLGTGGTAIAQYVGEYNAPGKFIQTPDAFINKSGAAQPRGPDGAISIVSNDIRQTISNITNFSDAGFGLAWYNTGPVNPAVSSFLGQVAGIGIHSDLESAVISNNAMHGTSNGIEVTGQLTSTVISNNTIFRTSGGNGISLSAGIMFTGSLLIEANLIDCDPYLESSSRTSPIDGGWTVTDGSVRMGIYFQNFNGVNIRGNRFRNCIRPIKYISGNYVNEKNIVEFDWTSANLGAGFAGISAPNGVDAASDIFWFCNSNPANANFNQYDLNFVVGSSAIPTTGTWFRGTFVRNFSPTLDGSNMTILGWIRLTSGSANVSGTDWAVARVSHVSPAT